MQFIEILLIAIGLAMDAFAVAIGIGSTRRAIGVRAVLRLSFHFGLFQFMMPMLGWLTGASIAHFISAVDHWIAFALLAFVGGRMILSGFDTDGVSHVGDPSHGRMLVTLAFATSIDAFAIGLSLAMLRIDIIFPSIVAGLVAAVFTLSGLGIGYRLGEIFGKRMEIIGGLILIGIGLRVLISDLF